MLFNVIKKIVSNDKRFFKIQKYIANRVGWYAEYLVIIFMFFKGYKLFKHRYRNYCGEIDLIFVRRKKIIFVEVKARSGEIDYFGLVSKWQKRRIIASANVFLSKYDRFATYGVQFDICVVFSMFPWRINHIKNAWN